MATVAALDDRVLDELAQIVGPQHVLTSKTARLNRARTPAMFAVHRWADHVPQVVAREVALGGPAPNLRAGLVAPPGRPHRVDLVRSPS